MKNSQYFVKSNTIFLILSLFIVASCDSSKVENKSAAPLANTSDIRKADLNAKAERLIELYNNKNCKEFFATFPNSFHELNSLYGYHDEDGENTLFSQSDRHINFFFDCPEVSDLEKLDKVVEIGIDGKWKADSVWMFQEASFNLIQKHSAQAKKILDGFPDEKAASFWYFLFDKPHPTDKENVKKVDLMRGLLGNNSKQAKLLSAQHRKLEADWKNH